MILLVSIPSVINSVIPRVEDPPLGLGYIGAFLKHHGYSTKILDFASFPVSLSQMMQKIMEFRPNLIGFTCYNSNYYLIKQLSMKLKKKNPDIKIVIGGPTPTFSDLEILKESKVFDYIVRGEGEHTILELVQELESKNPNYKKIDGISFLQNDQIIQNPDRKLELNLDQFPSPYLENVFEMELYNKGSLLTGRGCNQNCMFCNCGIMFGHKIRHHSVDRIMGEIDKLVKDYNITKINFHDDTFSSNPKFAKTLLRKIIASSYKIQIWMETRIDHIDNELFELMAKANVKQMNFGLESGDSQILKFIRKVRYGGEGLEPEKKFLERFKSVFKSRWRTKFNMTYSFIIGHPNETYQNALNTIKFVKLLGERNGVPNILALIQGTEIWQRRDEFGFKYKPNKKMHFPYKILKFSKLSKKEIIDLLKQIPNNLLANSYKYSLFQTISKKLLGIPPDQRLGQVTRNQFVLTNESIMQLTKKYLDYGDN